MARKKVPDRKTSAKIMAVLKRNPRGIWVREIARRTKIPKSTVQRYLSTYLKPKVKLVASVKGLVKLYRAK